MTNQPFGTQTADASAEFLAYYEEHREVHCDACRSTVTLTGAALDELEIISGYPYYRCPSCTALNPYVRNGYLVAGHAAAVANAENGNPTGAVTFTEDIEEAELGVTHLEEEAEHPFGYVPHEQHEVPAVEDDNGQEVEEVIPLGGEEEELPEVGDEFEDELPEEGEGDAPLPEEVEENPTQNASSESDEEVEESPVEEDEEEVEQAIEDAAEEVAADQDESDESESQSKSRAIDWWLVFWTVFVILMLVIWYITLFG